MHKGLMNLIYFIHQILLTTTWKNSRVLDRAIKIRNHKHTKKPYRQPLIIKITTEVIEKFP